MARLDKNLTIFYGKLLKKVLHFLYFVLKYNIMMVNVVKWAIFGNSIPF